MGHVRVSLRLSNQERPNGAVEVDDALVDTGATWTCIPREIAIQLDLRTVGRIPVTTAAGPQALDQTYAFVELEGKSMVSPLLISDTLEKVLVGVTLLEWLGFVLDPTKEELRESEVFLL